ncbi:hypothetical protein H6G56_14175 [Anabaena variabilis FACHB-164]|nr:hypothetical protein [Trichormus variabilis FACHB-164]
MEIHTGIVASGISSNTIPCDRLALSETTSDECDTDSYEEITPINTTAMVSSINTKVEDTTKPLQILGLASVD